MLVRNGCVCCTVRGDLISTLGDLTDRQRRGDVGALDRVVIETTGFADPAPILHTLMNDRTLLDDYGLGAVVTTIDAVNGLNTLDQHQEAVKQIGIADLLLLYENRPGSARRGISTPRSYCGDQPRRQNSYHARRRHRPSGFLRIRALSFGREDRGGSELAQRRGSCRRSPCSRRSWRT